MNVALRQRAHAQPALHSSKPPSSPRRRVLLQALCFAVISISYSDQSPERVPLDAGLSHSTGLEPLAKLWKMSSKAFAHRYKGGRAVSDARVVAKSKDDNHTCFEATANPGMLPEQLQDGVMLAPRGTGKSVAGGAGQRNAGSSSGKQSSSGTQNQEIVCSQCNLWRC